MTSKKVDNLARRETFYKRKKSIIKKESELITTLCGIQASAICSNPFDSQTKVRPDLEGTKHVIEKYQNTSMIDESKNKTQESFILQRIAEAKDQLAKQIQDNREKELTIAMFGYMQDKKLPDNLPTEELRDLEKLIDKKLKEIDNKIDALS